MGVTVVVHRQTLPLLALSRHDFRLQNAKPLAAILTI